MNCLLFKTEEELSHLPISDYRAEHIKKYLKPKDGDTLFVAIVNKYLAKARVYIKEKHYSFEVFEKLPCAKLRNIEVAVALPRPQIAQKILFDSACLGVSKLNFYVANKSEASYVNSSLYAQGQYEDYLLRGAEQACNCYIPDFQIHENLEAFLSTLPDDDANTLRVAPDLYATAVDFSQVLSHSTQENALLIMGAERGFNDAERKLLEAKSFSFALMRERVMRTDTALVYALALLHNI